MSKGTTTRKTGWEWRVAGWAVRHPGVVGVPSMLTAGAVEFGAAPTACAVGVALGGLGAWYRGHPATFDPSVGRWLRTWRRRWLDYVGARWRPVMQDCDLTKTRRGTEELLVPRVLRVRATTPSIDVLTVRMLTGQKPSVWEERAEELAHAFGAERLTVNVVKPGVLALIVERRNPFTEIIPAPQIPEHSAEVDLDALAVGEDEYGEEFTIRLPGRCLLVVGTMGAGKGTFIWAPLRAMGPAIRDGVVRVRVIDLKGGMETEQGRPLFADWAADVGGALRILKQFRDDMRARQAELKAARLRKFQLSTQTPFEWLVIDELAMLSAYAGRSEVLEAMRLLGEIQTQGRAVGFGVAAYVQEPTKDIVDTRELFTDRICLAVTAASHVDMVLGDGARDKGALADQIPLDEDHAGIGFVRQHRSRRLIRIRGGYVNDAEIEELVASCAPPARLAPVRSLPKPGEGVAG
ncbi:MAG: cell division protein FtsK [Actinobacteria bacterium]|nr:cell division protein FtsK [Actinomycetota bacterium]